MNVKNFSTINSIYLVEEVKEGFDKFELGNTGIQIEMRPRTGVGKFTNFSKRCRVIANSDAAKYEIGENVWLPHNIANNVLDGGKIDSSLSGKDVFYCGEHNVMFTGESLAEIKSDEWVIFQVKKGGVRDGAILLVESDDDSKGVVVSGALPKGTEITWYTHKRQEVFQNEVQHWICHIDHVTTINGEINEKAEFYKIDTFEDAEAVVNGIFYKGQAAILKQNNIGSPLPVKHFITRLENQGLPHHGKLAIVRKARKGLFVSLDEVLLIVGND